MKRTSCSSRPAILISAILLVLTGVAASAQPAGNTETRASESQLSNTSVSLTFSTQWVGSADFDTAPGDVSVARLGARFGVRHALNKQLALRFGAGLEYSAYDFSGATGFIAGTSDPYDSITIATLSLGADYAADERNAWFGTAFVRSSGQAGADFGDTITGGGNLGYRRQINDNLALGIAVSAVSELEDSVYVIPIPIIDWKISDKWNLSTTDRGFVQLQYTRSPAWSFGLEGGYERREYRLDKTGPLPSGVVDERRIPIYVFATYTPSPNFILTGRVGSHVWSNFEFDNSAGNQIAEDDVGAALAVGLDLSIRF